ncbi:hypothetical protein R3P38DRAFT_3169093 [Favolaschia claudopus]|uniref:Uncharacterized protein n=1 Tax=Favolaschia claudopus TaxID=2862362 RepID=A0AAW0E1A4_9AGAR
MAHKNGPELESISLVEKQARQFIQDMVNGKHNKESYVWPKFDLSEASPESCKAILSFLKRPAPRSYKDTTQTPPRDRIYREVDMLVHEREYFVKKRALNAQKIEGNLGENILIIQEFLRAARRGEEIEYEFPHSEWKIVKSIDAIRACMRQAEEILKLSIDNDATSEDSQRIQAGDETLVDPFTV